MEFIFGRTATRQKAMEQRADEMCLRACVGMAQSTTSQSARERNAVSRIMEQEEATARVVCVCVILLDLEQPRGLLFWTDKTFLSVLIQHYSLSDIAETKTN